MEKLLHVLVDSKLKKKMKELIDAGLFTNYAEIAREGVRDTVQKYK